MENVILTDGRMDRCGAAHRRRASVNLAARERLEDWAMSLAPAKAGAAVLDLGCGAGKLTLPYARSVGAEGCVVGVDLAPDSIAALQADANAQGLSNVTARVGNLDDFTPTKEDCACNKLHALPDVFTKKFDLIVSSYAIYYATDMPGLIRSLAARLTADGRVFLCGPGAGTNREMNELVRDATPDADPPAPLVDFISPEQIDAAAGPYAKVETFRLDNAVRFTEPDALLGWWRNHNMYRPATDEAVSRAAREHFATNDEFTLTKNVLGVLFWR